MPDSACSSAPPAAAVDAGSSLSALYTAMIRTTATKPVQTLAAPATQCKLSEAQMPQRSEEKHAVPALAASLVSVEVAEKQSSPLASSSPQAEGKAAAQVSKACPQPEESAATDLSKATREQAKAEAKVSKLSPAQPRPGNVRSSAAGLALLERLTIRGTAGKLEKSQQAKEGANPFCAKPAVAIATYRHRRSLHRTPQKSAHVNSATSPAMPATPATPATPSTLPADAVNASTTAQQQPRKRRQPAEQPKEAQQAAKRPRGGQTPSQKTCKPSLETLFDKVTSLELPSPALPKMEQGLATDCTLSLSSVLTPADSPLPSSQSAAHVDVPGTLTGQTEDDRSKRELGEQQENKDPSAAKKVAQKKPEAEKAKKQREERATENRKKTKADKMKANKAKESKAALSMERDRAERDQSEAVTEVKMQAEVIAEAAQAARSPQPLELRQDYAQNVAAAPLAVMIRSRLQAAAAAGAAGAAAAAKRLGSPKAWASPTPRSEEVLASSTPVSAALPSSFRSGAPEDSRQEGCDEASDALACKDLLSQDLLRRRRKRPTAHAAHENRQACATVMPLPADPREVATQAAPEKQRTAFQAGDVNSSTNSSAWSCAVASPSAPSKPRRPEGSSKAGGPAEPRNRGLKWLVLSQAPESSSDSEDAPSPAAKQPTSPVASFQTTLPAQFAAQKPPADAGRDADMGSNFRKRGVSASPCTAGHASKRQLAASPRSAGPGKRGRGRPRTDKACMGSEAGTAQGTQKDSILARPDAGAVAAEVATVPVASKGAACATLPEAQPAMLTTLWLMRQTYFSP
eukprot:TRINITY_DN10553_c0_g1_i3.p1 TRINITY_DN10553_c0_g1~~TRINITY_DN10553_c0_g1_i3.p1  ORF type:complete len:804 (+),score=202.28 TRINITY_DN10553_c0_g1_i3:183-2594(+)